MGHRAVGVGLAVAIVIVGLAAWFIIARRVEPGLDETRAARVNEHGRSRPDDSRVDVEVPAPATAQAPNLPASREQVDASVDKDLPVDFEPNAREKLHIWKSVDSDIRADVEKLEARLREVFGAPREGSQYLGGATISKLRSGAN